MGGFTRGTGICLCGMLLLFLSSVAIAAPKERITFWTTEIEPKCIDIQQGLAERFEEAVGSTVEIIPIKANELSSRIKEAAAASALPDTLLAPLDYAIGWAAEGILDPAAASTIIDELGENTFADGPLALARVKEGFAAVPADGQGLLLLYRKDLFVGKGVEAMLGVPNTWESILKAAKAVHHPPGVWGFSVGTDPEQVYTQQIFEQFALSNGVRLINPRTGRVDLNTPEFIQTLQFYKTMAGMSPPEVSPRRKPNEDYLSGKTAMTIWSPSILNELAGLNDSVPVTLRDLQKPLHEMTGIVAGFRGPLGFRPSQWGRVNYFGITAGARRDAEKWVTFLLSDGYLDWLSMAPEGKFPLRRQFVDGWKNLSIGVDREAKISDLYPDDVVSALISGIEWVDRWGYASGRGACVGQLYESNTLIKILRRYLADGLPAEAAAQEMTREIEKLAGYR